MEHIVTGCRRCVFNDGEYCMCNHPSLDIEFKWADLYNYLDTDNESPEFCPLKKEEIVIKIKSVQ